MAVVVNIADAICFDLLGLYNYIIMSNSSDKSIAIQISIKLLIWCCVLQVTREEMIMENRKCGVALVSVFSV